MARTRDPDLDRRIHEATIALLRRDGLDRMTVDDIAATAGVGKAAIYRRYRSKGELVVGAVDDVLAVPAPDDLGAGPAALAEVVESLRRALFVAGGLGLLATLLTAADDDAALAALWRRRIVGPRVGMLDRVLPATGADPQLIGELALGGLVARHLARGPVTAADARALTEALWALATATAPRAAAPETTPAQPTAAVPETTRAPPIAAAPPAPALPRPRTEEDHDEEHAR